MKCRGKYKFRKQTYDCERKFGCKHFSIRAKLQNWTPVSKTQICDQRISLLNELIQSR